MDEAWQVFIILSGFGVGVLCILVGIGLLHRLVDKESTRCRKD